MPALPAGLTQWLAAHHPNPHVHRHCPEACPAWVLAEHAPSPAADLPAIIQHVDTQLLNSDLRDSMVPGTGLPTHVSTLQAGALRGPPVLVELVALTEIGHGAFALAGARE